MINARSVFCLGIGGIGVSALARLLHARGIKVRGSDLFANEATQRLRRQGVTVHIGKAKAHLPRTVDLVIFSPAVPVSHPLRRYAAAHNVQLLSYPQALWQELQDKKVVAVAGTHGKTTVTALLGWILTYAKKDPTIVVGGFMKNGNTNARRGRGQYAVVEADEFDRSFHQLHPDVAVVNNIDHDHFDTYPTFASLTQSFRQFVAGMRGDGTLVVNADNAQTRRLGGRKARTFGLDRGQYRPTRIRETERGTSFNLRSVLFSSPLFGRHNVMNVAAAAAAANACGVTIAQCARAVARYQGTWRRFERLERYRGFEVVSDYGHHPTEIVATITAARQRFQGRPLVVVFQPHQHNRTKHLVVSFARSLSTADIAIVTEIFTVSGRVRASERKISAQAIARLCRAPAVIWAPKLRDVATELRQLKLSKGVLLFVGAGSIDSFARTLINQQ